MTMPESSSPVVVKVGMRVELELIDQDGETEKMAVQIVDEKAADFSAGFIAASTPLARAILGQPSGKTLPYRIGDLRAVRILSISAGTSQPEEDAANRREVAIKKAVAEVDRTNAILFASSFSGKWGDYDPEGVEKWDTQDQQDEGPPEGDPH